jgi:hypothetical protein
MILDNLPPNAIERWRRGEQPIEDGMVDIYEHAVRLIEDPGLNVFALSGAGLSLLGWCEDPVYGPASTSTFDTTGEPDFREHAIMACLWAITVAEISDEELIAMRVARRLTQSQGGSNGQ